ncbi:MAG TPA: SPFH domain-containing protein [Candidatus Binatia bacterium]|jgi:regulator of protease activity HflC (stomatin/prohibitin superfamily)|nr:SPFH domain-containing protein [Candidatus Binatia bacterium]
MSFLGPLIIFVAIVVFGLIAIARTLKVVNQGLVGVVLRVGQFHAVRDPGLTLLLPFIDRIVKVDMRETPRTGERQDVITKDNVSLSVNATIFSQVIDARLALFAVSNYFVAIDQLARTTLRSVMGSLTLDECLSQREQINAQLQAAMESVTDKWGIRINRVEILDIIPPQQILQAMALQKQADQEKRAAILQSEGQQQSQVNVAEGAKQAAVRQAEGERQAQILRAEAQKQSVILNAEGQKEAQVLEAAGRAQAISAIYDAINKGNPTPEVLAVLQLDTLGKVAASPNSKVVVPVETAGLLGAAQALKSMVDAVPTANGQAPR